MNIAEVNDTLNHISLAQDQKKALLQLIDAKINNDMKEVIAEIKKLEDKIQMNHDKHSNEMKIVYWVIGIAMAVMFFVYARK